MLLLLSAPAVNPAQPGARGMKVAATGLLVAMAALFVVARALEHAYPWLGFVKAFAEAAMVGGLADWFAVTALFRHPLGLPIPHTAIIPRNKDRIGEALASFLRDNFLIASVVARRMRNIDLAGAAGRFLRAAGRRRDAHPPGRLTPHRRHFRRPRRRTAGRHRQGRDLVALRAMEVSPLLGHALASAINEDRHVPMLEAAIRWTARTLDANEPLIRDMVKKRANWALKLAGLDTKLADSIIEGLRKLTVEMSTDPAHPVRLKVEEALAQLANDLQTNAETRERVEAMKDELLANQSVSLWLDTLWQKGREAIIKRRPQSRRGDGRQIRRGAQVDGHDAGGRRAHPRRDQPVRPARGGRHGGELRRVDRQIGVGNDPRLGRPDDHRPPRSRGRPRPPIYPHQRHLGRRTGRRDAVHACWITCF